MRLTFPLISSRVGHTGLRKRLSEAGPNLVLVPNDKPGLGSTLFRLAKLPHLAKRWL